MASVNKIKYDDYAALITGNFNKLQLSLNIHEINGYSKTEND